MWKYLEVFKKYSKINNISKLSLTRSCIADCCFYFLTVFPNMSSHNVFIYLFTRTKQKLFPQKNNLFIDLFILTKQNLYINFLSQKNIYVYLLSQNRIYLFPHKNRIYLLIYVFDILIWLDLECWNLKFEKCESFT